MPVAASLDVLTHSTVAPHYIGTGRREVGREGGREREKGEVTYTHTHTHTHTHTYTHTHTHTHTHIYTHTHTPAHSCKSMFLKLLRQLLHLLMFRLTQQWLHTT